MQLKFFLCRVLCSNNKLLVCRDACNSVGKQSQVQHACVYVYMDIYIYTFTCMYINDGQSVTSNLFEEISGKISN